MMPNVKSVEFFLLLLVGLISLAANLPQHVLGQVIDQKLLLIVLAAVVVIALFRYLRLLLFLCVVILAIGANLPERLSESLGLSQTVMLIFLVCIVVVSLAHRFLKMPGEMGPTPRQLTDNEETRKAMMIAVSIGNVKRLKWLIAHNMEFNFSDHGASPILLAAEKGNSEIMQLLIHHGADLNVTNADGKTALEIALAHGFNRTAELIKFALENRDAAAGQSLVPPGQPLAAHSGPPAKIEDAKEVASAARA